MTALERSRRHPAARIVLLMLGLVLMGGLYAGISAATDAEADVTTASQT